MVKMNCATEANSPDPYHIKHEIQAAPRPIAGKKSNIVDFYAHRSVLITGASGFIGKVLIEKLVRTCPLIKRIFVLIRPKWNKKPEDRLRELLESPLYDGVRDQRLEERIILVEGDMMQPNLGLNGNSLSRIIKEVSVIFHSAATVKFDDPLKLSVGINIAGTKNMIEICRRIPQLAALVHVSTAYANCDRTEIDEYIYPVDMDPEKLIQMADWLDQDTLQELKRRLLGARPNTYTYTKALAEWLLVRSARDLPVVVCRPSIVVASSQEPFKGWIDNVNGPTGVILGAGKGLIRTMFAEKDFVADLVPVDLVINLVITLGWFAYINKGQKHLNEAAESFSDSILSGRSTSPSASGCSNSSAASTSGDENYDIEHQHDSLTSNERNACNSKSAAVDQNQDLPSTKQQQTHATQLQLHTTTLDDGYGSLKNSDYNSVASSDTASTSSSASYRKSHHHYRQLHSHYQHRRRQTRPSIKISCTSANEKQQQLQHQQQEQHLDDLAAIDETTLSDSKVDDYVIDEVIQGKLKLFRQKTKAKLNESNLPEELADVPVFHCTSGSENPITWGRVQILIVAALTIFPSTSTYRYPCGSFTNNKLLDDFYRLTLHFIPGYIADFITKLFGGKPMIVKLFNKFDQAATVLREFTSKQWKFNTDNRQFLLEELMNVEDRRLFNFDIRSVRWDELCYNYVLGVRKFMLKESMNNLEQARSNLRMIYYRNLSLQVLFIATFAYYFVSRCTSILY